jgi:Arc/MetJ-type ribon-helix-helix transcriptional regulator
MSVAKVAVSIDQNLLAELDCLVAKQVFSSRSQAVQAAVREKVARLKRCRLAEECAKMDPQFEKSMAEEGMAGELALMPITTSRSRHRIDRYPTSEGRASAFWKPVLELDSDRVITAGGTKALCDAIRRGADLRIRTDFVFNEHLDTASKNSEPVVEVSDFRVTYLVEDRWAAGIMSLRMPVCPPDGFGPRASMSFFMYNQDGRQAIARPYLDGPPAAGPRGPSPLDDQSAMPKYHQIDNWDAETNAPSSNFIYDFDLYRYLVWDHWEEVFSHTKEGEVELGSVDALYEAFRDGCEVKVGIRGLCADLVERAGGAQQQAGDMPRAEENSSDIGHGNAADKAFDSDKPVADHTLFVQTGPGYYCTERKLFSAGAQPVVRVRPDIPMRYLSGGWDFGWLMPRSDGFVAQWLCDPYTLRFHKRQGHYPIRWFVR